MLARSWADTSEARFVDNVDVDTETAQPTVAVDTMFCLFQTNGTVPSLIMRTVGRLAMASLPMATAKVASNSPNTSWVKILPETKPRRLPRARAVR